MRIIYVNALYLCSKVAFLIFIGIILKIRIMIKLKLHQLENVKKSVAIFLFIESAFIDKYLY
jgi:hypothetical protein